MSPNRPTVPARIVEAVALAEVDPHDDVLELGCGPGAAVGLLAAATDGSVTAVDRSATAVARTRDRHSALIDEGRLRLERATVADAPAVLGRRFDLVLAINVNAFWVDPAGADAAALPALLARGGRAVVAYEAPGGRAAEVAGRTADALTALGLRCTVADGEHVVAVTARPH